jgi:hypothetical protein
MSGTTPKTIPEINLDEFERRLRAAGAPSTGVEDPLAELTRLVNAVHSDARRAARPGRDEAPGVSADGGDEPELGPLPAFAAPPRSAFTDSDDRANSEDHAAFDEAAEPPPLTAPVDAMRAAAPQRSSGWTFKIVGLSVLGFALLVGAIAIKNGRVPGLTKAPPFIAADDAPTKVQPPNEAAVQSNGDIAGLLMKDSASPMPVKMVSNEEQPVDLRTQTQPGAPGADAAATPAAGGSPVANAPDTPVVPPAASTSVAPLFPAAKPVKTVSVRPDGSLIASDAAPAAPPPPSFAPTPPPKSTARALDATNAAPDAATPKLDIPTKLAPPKPAARVVAKTDTTAPAEATDTTPSAPLQIGGPRPAKPALAAPPPQTVASAAPNEVSAPMVSSAPADPVPAAGGGDGLWGVQLAAPHSEADAKSAINRLKSKYADALGDSELGVHEADVKGQTIYRVRVTGLSKSDAGALCAKLKAGGGDCFVAKD